MDTKDTKGTEALTEYQNLAEKVEQSIAKMGEGYATKLQVDELNTMVRAMSEAKEKVVDSGKKVSKIFNSDEDASQFLGMWWDLLEKTWDRPAEFPRLEKATQSVQTPSAGGILSPTAFPPVLNELITQWGYARRLHNVDPVIGSVQYSLAGADTIAYFQVGSDDSGALLETKTDYGHLTLTPETIAGLTFVTEKLMSVATIPVADRLMQNLARAVAYREDWATFRGNGVSDGLNGGVTGYVNAGLQTINTTVVAMEGADKTDPILDAWALLHPVVQSTAAIYMNAITLAWLKTIKSATLNYMPRSVNWGLENSQLGVQPVGDYDGRPIVLLPILQGGQASHEHDGQGQHIILVGDLRQTFQLVEGRRVRFATSTEFRFNRLSTALRVAELFSAGCIHDDATVVIDVD